MFHITHHIHKFTEFTFSTDITSLLRPARINIFRPTSLTLCGHVQKKKKGKRVRMGTRIWVCIILTTHGVSIEDSDKTTLSPVRAPCVAYPPVRNIT